MSSSVKIDLSGVRRKISHANLRRGTYAVAYQAMADMNRFVPMKEGNLRQAAHVADDGSINYEMKYARKQFYLNGRKYSTPGTGPRWDLKAKGIYMPSWKKAFVKGAGIN